MKDVNVKHEIIKIVEDDMEDYFYNIQNGEGFSKYTYEDEGEGVEKNVQNENIDTFDYFKINLFYIENKQLKVKRQMTNWEKIVVLCNTKGYFL